LSRSIYDILNISSYLYSSVIEPLYLCSRRNDIVTKKGRKSGKSIKADFTFNVETMVMFEKQEGVYMLTGRLLSAVLKVLHPYWYDKWWISLR